MSKFSNALHAVFGFVKAELPSVEAEAKAIRDKAEKDVAALQVKAQATLKSKTAVDLKAALATVSNAVLAHVETLTAPAPVAGPTGTTGPAA